MPVPQLFRGELKRRLLMKTWTSIAMAAAILATAVPAHAAKKDPAYAAREASCKTQAANKYSAIHFLKRRDFVKQCMGETSSAKKAKTTTGRGG
jgi:hypothetical protein